MFSFVKGQPFKPHVGSKTCNLNELIETHKKKQEDEIMKEVDKLAEMGYFPEIQKRKKEIEAKKEQKKEQKESELPKKKKAGAIYFGLNNSF